MLYGMSQRGSSCAILLKCLYYNIEKFTFWILIGQSQRYQGRDQVRSKSRKEIVQILINLSFVYLWYFEDLHNLLLGKTITGDCIVMVCGRHKLPGYGENE